MLICGNCGKKIEKGKTTCRFCGEPGVEVVEQESTVVSTFSKPGIQMLLVVAAALLAYFLVRTMVTHKAVAAVVQPSAAASPSPSTGPAKKKPAVTLPPDPSSSDEPVLGDDSGLSGMVPALPFVGPDPGNLAPVDPGAPNAAPATGNPEDQPATASMPQDVKEYLDFVQSIEQERQSLASQQMSGAASLAGSSANSPDGGASDYANASMVMRAAWTDLSQRFNAETAPPECASVRSVYNSTLNGTRALMTDLLSALRTAARSPERAVVTLTRIRDEVTDRVDQPAESADEAVDAVCVRYDVDKWFDIDNRVADRLISQLGL